MQLEYEITNQKLERKDKNIIVNGTVKYVTCTFTFKTSDWTGADKYAIFKTECQGNICVPLGSTCTATVNVPGKALMSDFFRLTIFGINDDERITTNELVILLDRSGFTAEFEPADPDESGDIFSST